MLCHLTDIKIIHTPLKLQSIIYPRSISPDIMGRHYSQKNEICEAGHGNSPVILASGRLRQEGCCKFKSNLGCTVILGQTELECETLVPKQQCVAWLCAQHSKCCLLSSNHVPGMCSMPNCSMAIEVCAVIAPLCCLSWQQL